MPTADRNPIVGTPNIDAIADGATVFERAFVNNPVCMPDRSTIMTGRMASAHGVIFNDRSLAPTGTTFVFRLREAGRQTALLGMDAVGRNVAAPESARSCGFRR